MEPDVFRNVKKMDPWIFQQGSYVIVKPRGYIAIYLENGPGLKMYVLLKVGIFQPTMLVYQRVPTNYY